MSRLDPWRLRLHLLVPPVTDLARGERELLPGRRNAPSVRVKIGDCGVYIRAGEYDDGRLGELFITVSKRGLELIDAGSALDAFAIAISLGLQYGVPLDAYVHRLVGTNSKPNGIVTGHDRIKFASSLHDLVLRHAAIDYLERDDLASVTP
jgi:ribonucleoside-diphosphate reductase alpha chain